MSIRIRNPGFWWPGGCVPFVINPGAFPPSTPGNQTIQNAINIWNTNTPIRLTPRNGEVNYVEFIGATAECMCPVGMQGGRQEITCDLNTFGVGAVMHEIGHAVGLYHEQSRADRNAFVSVRFENIWSQWHHNYLQEIGTGEDIGEYDYGSLMHYARRTAFGVDPGVDEIVAPMTVQIGQRNQLSPNDRVAVELTYSQSSGWHRMHGLLSYISVGSATEIWGTNSGQNVFRFDQGEWRTRPGQLMQVSVASDGTVWGVRGDHAVFRWNGAGWDPINALLTHVSVGSANDVWGVNNAGQVYQWDGTAFGQVQSPELHQVSVGTDGSVWGVSRSLNVWRWNGAGFALVNNALLSFVSNGGGGNVWGTNGDAIFRLQGGEWQPVSGRLKYISVAADDTVWGVNGGSEIFRREP